MGCFPSKQTDDGRALARSSISHQTQIPIQADLHDADTESVVFTAGRPSFGFNTIPPHINNTAAAPPRKSLGAQPGGTKPMAMVPTPLQLQHVQQQMKRPEFHRARSVGPASAGAISAGGKPKVTFVAQLMMKEREKEMMWDNVGLGASPMTAPPTRETFGR